MIKKIEKLQKTAVYILLGKHAHKDYFCNLAILSLDTLENRRHSLSIKFASKILKHPEHRKIFNISSNGTRAGKNIVVPPARTSRYDRSSIPSLAKLINEHLQGKI